MATEDQVLQLRLLVNEPDDSNGWTDEKLAAIADEPEMTLNGAASKIWYLKAGTLANLVDVTESGSSRKLGDLMKNAKEMGALYGAADGAVVETGNAPIIQRIRRGFA